MATTSPRRDHTQFEDTKVEGLARTSVRSGVRPVRSRRPRIWHGWTDLRVQPDQPPIESKFQTAMLGKAIRDSNLMDGQTLKLSKVAVEQAARGLKNTNEQVAFGRAVDRMYGKYNKFSPEGRMALALYTPFVAWTLNAVKFVYRRPPARPSHRHRPDRSTEMATDEWRKSTGWTCSSTSASQASSKAPSPHRAARIGRYACP
jgi:hypothetical protein